MMRGPQGIVGRAICGTTGFAVSALLAASAVSAATVPPLWDGVRRVQVLCLVTDGRGVDTGPLHQTLCRKVRDRTAIGSPVPVTVLAQPGSEVLDASALTLLVQASLSDTPDGRLMALSVRPYRNQAGDGGTLFGAPPRAAALRGAASASAIDALVETAIGETVPWHAPPGAKRLPRP